MNKLMAGFYLITGPPGSGKSAIHTELLKRGFMAMDGDDIASFIAKETGLPATEDNSTDIAWEKQHSWDWKRPEIEKLATIARSQAVFLCGAATNSRDFYPLFGRKFRLTLDEKSLVERILTRTGKSYGKGPGQIEQILEWKRDGEKTAASHGEIIINAVPPVEEVVDTILSHLYEP